MGLTAGSINKAKSAVNTASPLAPSFYTPFTNPPSGTLLSQEDWPQNAKAPMLFTPITVGKGENAMTLKNRIVCYFSNTSLTPPTYLHLSSQELCSNVPVLRSFLFVFLVLQATELGQQAKDGLPTPWHMVHLGTFATRGAGLVFTEACAVLSNGRITPQCCGIWSSAHTEAWKPIVAYIQSQGAKAGIQIAHAGRKASTLAPWLDASTMSANVSTAIAATGEAGGWEDVWAPSAIPFAEDKYPTPVEMGDKEIEELKQGWKDAVTRADEAGFDLIECHLAHGYLLHNFLSPLSNHRTDKYGGSLENRLRLPLELIEITRATLPAHKPVFIRISATDWHAAGEKDAATGEYISWGLEQSAVLLQEAIKRGVDLMDVSSGGNDVKQQIKVGPGYQVPFAEQLRAGLKPEARIPISSVGLITSGKQAEEILQTGKADVSSPSPSPRPRSTSPLPSAIPANQMSADAETESTSTAPVSMSSSLVLDDIKEGEVSVKEPTTNGTGVHADTVADALSESAQAPTSPSPTSQSVAPATGDLTKDAPSSSGDAVTDAAATLPTPPPSAPLPSDGSDTPLAKILEGLPALSIKEQEMIQKNLERLGEYPATLPLSASWTMYFSDTSRATKASGATQEQYTEAQTPLFTVDSVPGLCGNLKAYKRLVRSKRARAGDPNTMGLATFRAGCNLYFFRAGVAPAWEDPWNEKGGRITISPPSALIDACYERLVLLIGGSSLEAATADIIAAQATSIPEGSIIGAVASRRARGDRIELWLGGKNKREPAPLAWVEILKECLATELDMPELRAGKYKKHL
ncbi:translation initiation factor 4E, partial [Phenoliferia sp. Uapishka_3]